MVGISPVGFNLVLGFTGAYWNLTHVAADVLGHYEDEPVTNTRLYSNSLSLAALTATAAEKMPGFETRWISFPPKQARTLPSGGRMPSGNPLGGDYGSNAVFDAQTGTLKTLTDLHRGGYWAQIADTFTTLHFGTFGGLPIKILWCLGGFAPGTLAVSGFLIWRSRR